MAESSLETARLLVNCGANVNATEDDYGDTPLHAAAQSGYCDITELLDESGTRIDVRNKYEQTSLHASSRYGHAGDARLLPDRGFDLNAPAPRIWTTLHDASRSGYL